MNGHLLALYVGAAFLAMIAPGPDMLFILATGARGGPHTGVLATLGVASSEIVQITAVAAGLSALFAEAPAAFTALRVCGAVYLLYLGIQALRSARRGSPIPGSEPGANARPGGLIPAGPQTSATGGGRGAPSGGHNAPSGGHGTPSGGHNAPSGGHGTPSGGYAFARGALTNLANPKSVTFVVAFLPQFVDRGLGHIPLQFAVLGAIFVALELLVDGTVGLTAGRLGGWLARRRRARQALDAGSGTIMVALACRLALEK
jgi:threonine/homoserine/homoserine lactone efflux protein